MPNLRIVYDNKADFPSSISASSTSGNLYISNTQTEYKTQIHRSIGSSVTYTLTWETGITVGCVGLPATNLTPDSTVQVKLYSTTTATTLVADSGQLLAAPGLDLEMWDWAAPLNVNTFSYGGLAKTTVWFDNQVENVKRCEIILNDTGPQSAGYIDCAKIIVGSFWSPEFNLEAGFEMGIVDTSNISRTDSGSLVADRGILHEFIRFDFSLLPEANRAQLTNILRKIGTSKNFLVSLLPNNENSSAEQDFIIYGKRTNNSFSNRVYSYYGHSMELIGW